MAEHIFVFSMLIVFLARDAQLLTAAAGRSLPIRLSGYAAAGLVYTIALVFMARSIPEVRILHLLRSPQVWGATLALHAVAWGACMWIKRRQALSYAWMLALVPTPVLLLSLTSLEFALRPSYASFGALPMVFAAWLTLVAVAAYWTQRQPVDPRDFSFMLDFAGLSNLTMLVVIPANLVAN